MSHICPECKQATCEAVERAPLSSSDPKADAIKAILAVPAIRAPPEPTTEGQTERMARAMFPILRDIAVRTFKRLGLWNGRLLEFDEMPEDQREALYDAARAAQKAIRCEDDEVHKEAARG